ncbi:MAG: stage II sporulation protein M [Candidatus Aenigmarchaeota archaeon]|nr:stage II sporulation protein M [Candidatus Aenigmarchaeota archaeon]
MRQIAYIAVAGAFLGFLAGTFVSLSFPQLQLTVRAVALEDAALVFMKNSLLATLIAFGGIIFSLLETRFYKSRRAYDALDRTVEPAYRIIGALFPGYRTMGKPYRSVYLALKAFPLMCVFFIALTISLYFSIFLSLLENAPNILANLLPHIMLELYVFFGSAALALKFSSHLRIHVLERDMASFNKEARSMLQNKMAWSRMLWLYFVLAVSAYVEMAFVNSIASL